MKTIIFEGTEGTGKSTFIREFIVPRLEDCYVIKEPSETLAAALKSKSTEYQHPSMLEYLFWQDRIKSFQQYRKHDNKCKCLVFDRSLVSSFVYQAILPISHKKTIYYLYSNDEVSGYYMHEKIENKWEEYVKMFYNVYKGIRKFDLLCLVVPELENLSQYRIPKWKHQLQSFTIEEKLWAYGEAMRFVKDIFRHILVFNAKEIRQEKEKVLLCILAALED